MGKPETVKVKGDFGGWEEREMLRQRRKLYGPGDPVPLMELDRLMCRFPVEDSAKHVGGMLFCGRPTAGDQPYCHEHQAIAIPAGRGAG